jgi:hypothetical protein
MLFDESVGFVFELRSPTQWLLHTLAVVVMLTGSFILCKVLLSQAKGGISRVLPLPPGPKDKWFYPGLR